MTMGQGCGRGCIEENVSVARRKKAEQRGNIVGNKKSAPKVLASRADLFTLVSLTSGFFIHSVFLMWRTSPVHVF